MLKKTLLCLAALAVASSLAAQTPPPRFPADQQVLWNDYFRSIYDSAVYQRDYVRKLYTPKPDSDGLVLVATLGRRDGDVGSEIVSTGEGIWVTVVPEVQNICRGFTGDVAMQLRQLLGLRPDDDVPRFLILKVKASDLFRPAVYPDTMTIYPCPEPPDDKCGNVFPPKPPDGPLLAPWKSHVEWMASASFSLHAVPGGYPWTHLGYTYNWAPGKDRYGASEYVIRAPAKATITKKATPADYCSSALP